MRTRSSTLLQKSFITIAVSMVVLVGLASTPVFAATTSTTKTDTKAKANDTIVNDQASPNGVQTYSSDSVIQDGTIVQLADSGKGKVAISNKADLGHMYGVTVNRQKLQLTISDSSKKNEVFVATSGTYDTLVSSQGGPIKSGDYVTLSAIDGVAMKASVDNTTVFGRAAAGFDGKNDGIGKVTLKDTNGKQTGTAVLGQIPISIDVRSNPEKKSTKSKLPDFLQRIGQAIAEKPVGALRIYLSIGITAICIISAVVILYSGIRNSLISIGRNPLSKKSIFRGLLEIIFTSLLILIVGLFAVYLLLKL